MNQHRQLCNLMPTWQDGREIRKGVGYMVRTEERNGVIEGGRGKREREEKWMEEPGLVQAYYV